MAKKQMYEVKVFNTFTKEYEVIGYSETKELDPELKKQLLINLPPKPTEERPINGNKDTYSWDEEYDFDKIIIGELVKVEIELPLPSEEKVKISNALQLKKGDIIRTFTGFEGQIIKYSSNTNITIAPKVGGRNTEGKLVGVSYSTVHSKVVSKIDIKEIITDEEAKLLTDLPK